MSPTIRNRPVALPLPWRPVDVYAALMQPGDAPSWVSLLAGGSTRPAWHADGLCREYPDVNFYPARGESSAAAKAVCGRCAVRDECLDYALDNAERYGIWGGTSERERQAMRGRRRKAA